MQIPTILQSHLQDPNLVFLNKQFAFLYERALYMEGGIEPVTVHNSLTAQKFSAKDISVPTLDTDLLTFGAYKKLADPNTLRDSFLTARYYGTTVQPLPPGPGSEAFGSTIIEADQYCVGGVLSEACINAAIAAAPAAGAAIHCKAGDWAIGGEVFVNRPNILLYGDGEGTVFKIDTGITFPRGVVQFSSGNTSLQNLSLDGQTTAMTQIDYSTWLGSTPGDNSMHGDPGYKAITQNSPVWVWNGVSTWSMYSVSIRRCQGYAVYLECLVQQLRNISIYQCVFEDNVAITFGDGTYTNCGAIAGGIFAKAGGAVGVVDVVGTSVTWVSGNYLSAWVPGQEITIDGTPRLISSVGDWGLTAELATSAGSLTGVAWSQGSANAKDLNISGCRFSGITGTGFWSHSFDTQNMHQNFTFEGNQVRDMGRDGVMMGAVLNGLVTGNSFYRIGYVAGHPAYYPGQYAVAIDTAGFARNCKYTGNVMLNINGGCMDLDGLSDSEVTSNVMIVSDASDPLYGPDEVASYGYGGSGNVTKGIQTNNTYDPAGAKNVTIANNTITNMGTAALVLLNAEDCFVATNNITHYATALDAPISIVSSGVNASWVSPPRFSRFNNIVENRIDYDVLGQQFCIYESDAFGTGVGPNTIAKNEIVGANKGEFLPSSAGLSAGSKTAQRFYTNSGTSALAASQIAATQLQREGSIGSVGTCNTSGNTVQRLTGPSFTVGLVGTYIVVNGVSKMVSAYTDASHVDTLEPLGSQTGVAWHAADQGVTKFYSVNLGTNAAPFVFQVGDSGPIMNVSYGGQANSGAVALGARTSFGILTEYFYGRSIVLDGYAVMARYNANTTQLDKDANSLTDDYGLLRYRRTGALGTGGAIEFSVSTTAGVRNWTTISGGSGSVGGADTEIQYNKAGAFFADSSLIWDYTNQQMIVTGVAATAGIAVANGFIQADGGFLVPNINSAPYNATDVIQAKAGGVTVKYLVGTDSLFLIGLGSAPAAPSAGQFKVYSDATGVGFYYDHSSSTWKQLGGAGGVAGSNKQVQYNNAGAFGASANLQFDPTLQLVTVVGIAATAGLSVTNAWVQADGGFQSSSASVTAINLPNGYASMQGLSALSTSYNSIQTVGGVLAKNASIITGAPSGTTYPVIAFNAGGAVFGRVLLPNASDLNLATNLLYNASTFQWNRDDTGKNAGFMSLSANASGTWAWPIVMYVTGPGGNPATMSAALSIHEGGNVGIGANPFGTAGVKLQVFGSIGVAGISVTSGFIQSDGGFYTASSATTAVNIPNGYGSALGWSAAGTSYNSIQVTSGGVLARSFTATVYVKVGQNNGIPAATSGDGIANGMLYYDTGTNLLMGRINGAWVSIGGGGSIQINGQSGSSFTLQGTANRVTVTTVGTTTTFTAPQDLHTAANVQFNQVVTTGIINSTIIGLAFQAGGGNVQISSGGAISIAGILTAAGGVNVTGSFSLNSIQTVGGVQASQGFFIGGTTIINSIGVFTGLGVNVGPFGITCGNYNLNGGYVGQTITKTVSDGFTTYTLTFRGGILVSYT